MSEDRVWDDGAREVTRAGIRSRVLGEVRLAKNSPEDIAETCDIVYILDDCPEDEQDDFRQFVCDELERAGAKLALEQAKWPAETDCDRLDRVEAALLNRDIVMWQASPCCDNCTLAEFQDRLDLLETRHPGIDDRIRGYCFFIDQNLPEMLAERTRISVYFAYGWISPDREAVEPEEYERNALGIAREVCACLREEGFEVDWDGSLAKKFCVMLDWRRRGRLE